MDWNHSASRYPSIRTRHVENTSDQMLGTHDFSSFLSLFGPNLALHDGLEAFEITETS